MTKTVSPKHARLLDSSTHNSGAACTGPVQNQAAGFFELLVEHSAPVDGSMDMWAPGKKRGRKFGGGRLYVCVTFSKIY